MTLSLILLSVSCSDLGLLGVANARPPDLEEEEEGEDKEECFWLDDDVIGCVSVVQVVGGKSRFW